ncbi:hypothetical protein ACJX0J_012712, partial [Zea mays]
KFIALLQILKEFYSTAAAFKIDIKLVTNRSEYNADRIAVNVNNDMYNVRTIDVMKRIPDKVHVMVPIYSRLKINVAHHQNNDQSHHTTNNTLIEEQNCRQGHIMTHILHNTMSYDQGCTCT